MGFYGALCQSGADVMPFLPLLLLQYPIADLSKKFVMRLVGL